MRELIGLSVGSFLSILLAAAPLGMMLPKLSLEAPASGASHGYLQCLPYVVAKFAPQRTFLHDCGGTVVWSRQDASLN